MRTSFDANLAAGYIDCDRAKFFTLCEVGTRPPISTHKSRKSAVRKGCKLANETGKHYAVAYEDSDCAVNFIRPARKRVPTP